MPKHTRAYMHTSKQAHMPCHARMLTRVHLHMPVHTPLRRRPVAWLTFDVMQDLLMSRIDGSLSLDVSDQTVDDVAGGLLCDEPVRVCTCMCEHAHAFAHTVSVRVRLWPAVVIHTSTQTQTHTDTKQIDTDTSVRAHTHMHAHTHACMHAHAHASRIHAHTYAPVHAHAFTCDMLCMAVVRSFREWARRLPCWDSSSRLPSAEILP